MTDSQLNIRRIDSRSQAIGPELDKLRERLSPRGDVVSEAGRRRTEEVFGQPLSPQQVVETICRDVRDQGMKAVLDYCSRLDKANLDAASIRVTERELASAHAAADKKFLDSVRRIRENILEYQRAILHTDVEVRRPGGAVLRQRYLPLERVGICVPGGAAAYPSTVLMTAVPAQAAGVAQLAVVTPPTKFGAYNTDLLATCHELGIREVYRVGGAQAVAALAWGVEGIPKVDKIVGPGNLFVALAKRFVFGEVDIDSIAGPSEIVVVADESARADFVAADLLAQAEHAPGAAILVTWSEALLDATEDQINRQLAALSRSELTGQSLDDFGALILVQDADQAVQVAESIAPEHLHIATNNAQDMWPRFRNAGAIFLGNYSPVVLGDYVAGPSHVLPTGGTARWANGLTANDFLRTGSIIQYDENSIREAVGDVQNMADKEGLTAHRASIDIRLA